MRGIVVAATDAALLIGVIGVAAQNCAQGTAKEISGNWYCSPVKAITYTNFPGTGSYARITNMDAKSGHCSSERYEYSGSLAPLNEELSLHVRGPLWLKQVAVYVPGDRTTKRDHDNAGFLERGHGHHHLHPHAGERHIERHVKHGEHIEDRAVGDLVSATINGKVDYWTNEYAGPSFATSALAGNAPSNAKQAVTISVFATASPSLVCSPVSSVPSAVFSANSLPTSVALDTSSSSPASTGSLGRQTHDSADAPSSSTALSGSWSRKAAYNANKPSASTASSGSWSRQAYYDADEGTSIGLTFLNHFGGTEGIPGTADGGSAFGASLSYASSDGKFGAASSQILSNEMIDDDNELTILSDKSCNDGGCGYTRPGGVAYHGFGGDHKVFLLEFSMPSTGKSGFNADMPAVWLMNAQIALTSQYGTNPHCSCWTTGCGEFDLFEVLDTGNIRCKSTLHMAPAGGSSDYFERPTKSTIKAAVVFAGSNETASIHIIDDAQSFDETLAGSLVDGFSSQAAGNGASSLFKLGG